MENNDDKEKEVKPQDSSHDPVPPSQEPEKKPDEGRKEAKPKKNVYDQYRYWGSDNGNGGKHDLKGSARRSRIALFALILLIISFAYVFLGDTSSVQRTETSYSAFLSYVENGNVQSATIVEQNVVNYTLVNGAGDFDVVWIIN